MEYNFVNVTAYNVWVYCYSTDIIEKEVVFDPPV